jgi:hypothetical protein
MTISRRHKSDLGFVVNGHERAIAGIKAEVRVEIEQKYADELSESGIFRRWFLSRRIHREIASCVDDRSAHISADSIF